MAFCPKCGKKTISGFCDECRPLDKLETKEIKVKVCTNCSKYFRKNKWVKPHDLTIALLTAAQDSIKEKLDSIKLKLPEFHQAPGVHVLISFEMHKGKTSFNVPGEVEFTYCDECAKKNGNYFEGTLQLRNINEEMMDFVDAYFRNNKVFVAGRHEADDGIDLDISDQRKLQNIGNLLKKAFGGTLKVSIRQFTQNRQTSKQIYRVNALYEGPKYKKGDVIALDKSVYLLTSVRKSISGIDLRYGKKTTLDLRKKEPRIVQVIKTTVTKIYPSVEILDPETYQSVAVENKKEVKIGEKIKAVSSEGLFYLI